MLLLPFAGLALMIGRAPRAATPTTPRATTVSAKYLDEPLLVPGAVAADPEKMDFFSQWFPLTSTRTLARGKPNALRLLDVPLVAWKAGNGWRVAEDRCPHRGAPLSYGRLEARATRSRCGRCTRATARRAAAPPRSRNGSPRATARSTTLSLSAERQRVEGHAASTYVPQQQVPRTQPAKT